MELPEFVALPASVGESLTAVEVRPLELADADEWDTRVKPNLPAERPDHEWSWRQLFFLARLPFRRGLAIRAAEGVVGLAAYNTSSYLLTNQRQSAFYVWYLSARPECSVKGIGRGLLYSMVRESALAGSKGRISLHADPSGGDDLLKLYRALGLAQVPGDLPGYKRQPNDGRFFELSSAEAERFVEETRRRGMLG
jgi:GNAT superfamily N-acetyltransferase